MEIRIIAALTRNGAIGRGGDLLFHISADLRRFKQLTMGCPIIMGRKTFESFPKGPLPGRRNVVVTRQPDYAREGVEAVPSLDAALSLVADAPKLYIIGGGEIYREAIPLATHLDLTEIDAAVTDADTYFPPIDPTEWAIDSVEEPTEPTAPQIRFTTLRRR